MPFKPRYLIEGLPGHPTHPPLTDATIGTYTVAAVLAVVDRLAGGGEKIEAAAGAPYRALTTIDEIYPDRPDRY